MVLLQPETSTTTPASRPSDDWFRRVAAVMLDGAVIGAVTWLAVGGSSVVPSLQPPFAGGLVTNGPGEAMDWVRSPWVLATLVVLVLLQAYTGATPGKRLVGILVVHEETGRPAGLWRTLARPVAHLLDGILFIGYLRPLWNDRRQTFADSILRTRVIVSRSPQLSGRLATAWGEGSRRRSRWVTAAAGLVCALGVGLSFPISRAETVPSTAPVACGDLSVPDGGELSQAEAAIRHDTWRQFDRRLWIEREASVHSPQGTISWTWNSTATTDTGAEPEAWLRTSDDPGAPDGTWSWSLPPQSAGQGRVTADMPLGSEDLAGVSGDGWLETTLVLDGVPVATCTMTAAELGLD